MEDSRFNILSAVKNAYMFVGSEWLYLLRLGVVPLAVQMVTLLALQSYRSDASVIESFLWNIPANILSAWYMFVEARLLLLGERLESLPQDVISQQDRRAAMKACVLVLLLFNMAVTAMAAGMEWSVKADMFGKNAAVSMAVMFLIGVLVWGLRFSVVHILAAVGYQILPFLRQVRGPGFSFRLMGMGILGALPVYFVMQLALTAALPGAVGELMTGQVSRALAISVPFSMIVSLLLNAAAAFALKEMLGQPRPWGDGMMIIVTDQEGREHELEALEGWRVMEVIRDHGLPIKAECGGACACATCHVYVDKSWENKLSPPTVEEIGQLDEAFEVHENSRLSCQILMEEKLDGLRITLAPGSEP